MVATVPNRRRNIRGVLGGLLGRYTSRYSDFDGYWLFGMLVSNLDHLVIDLLQADETPPRHPLALAEALARSVFRDQMAKAGLPLSRAAAASIELKRSSTPSGGHAGDYVVPGFDVTFIARVVSDLGTVYQHTTTIFVAPHDPRREMRATRRLQDDPSRAAPPAQTWHPDVYEKNARFVAELGQPVVDLLGPRRGERVLDLGCGDGVLTARLVELGCDVVGADSSAALVDAARARGLDVRLKDGHALDFGPEFDAVFSNAALHWMKGADRVLAGVYRALRPGGRFVGEFGGSGCVETIHAALIAGLDRRGFDGRAASPWYFPTTEDYGQKLAAAGFDVSYIALIPRPTPLPGDILGWLETFSESFTRGLPVEERASYLDEVRVQVMPRLCDAQGTWTADYVRLRFAATKNELRQIGVEVP